MVRHRSRQPSNRNLYRVCILSKLSNDRYATKGTCTPQPATNDKWDRAGLHKALGVPKESEKRDSASHRDGTEAKVHPLGRVDVKACQRSPETSGAE